MRVAIYARYSNERQNERSIEDQITVCSRHAAARGWTVVEAYTDAALSGGAMANRPGLNAAVAAAEAKAFDILLAEDEDRLARNLEHLAHVKNRLDFAGVKIATLTTDQVEDMHVALKGYLASDFLKNLSRKTKRGMQSNAEKGLATGSRLYGYRSAPGGALAIVEEEAEVVRRIFRDYAEGGLTPREIAGALNAERVPSPRGGAWNASTINGSRQRANGVLNMELYAGIKVWNRIEMRRDPRTGRRISRPRPESEWKRTPVPELAILPSKVWDRARARKSAEGPAKPYQLVRRRQAGLLSGLLKCAYCGSSYTVASGEKLTCAGRRERGPSFCANGRTVQRPEIEARVVDGLRTRLLAPEAVAEYVRTFREAFAQERAQRAERRRPVEKRLAEVTRGLDRAVDALIEGLGTAATLKDKILGLEAEKTALTTELAQLVDDDQLVELHPNAPQLFQKQISELMQALEAVAAGDAELSASVVDAVRSLVDRIEISPHGFERGDPIDVILYGRLAAFMDCSPGSASALSSMRKVVAGGGYSLWPTGVRVGVFRLRRR